MAKIILDLTVSLDGFIEGPNREVDWIVFDDEIGEDLVSFADEIDTVFYGRTSYTLYGNYLPDETASPFEREFYSKINAMKKYVFSNTLSQVDTQAEFISGNIRRAVLSLKERADKDIWLFGGAGIVTTFLNLGLIDELRIGINPVILSAGNPLFKSIVSRHQLQLIRTKIYTSGVVGLYYRVGTS